MQETAFPSKGNRKKDTQSLKKKQKRAITEKGYNVVREKRLSLSTD